MTAGLPDLTEDDAQRGHFERRPCPHGCPGGHTEDEYYGGGCAHRDSEPFEGFRDEDRRGHFERDGEARAAAPTITVEFTVSRTYRAEVDPAHFTGLARFEGARSTDHDVVGETVQRYLEGRWTERCLLAEYYANDETWDGDDPEVDIDVVEVDLP